jgi:hypothetical protein
MRVFAKARFPFLINGTITGISGGDAFDAWCNHRDRQYAQSPTNQYVSQDVVGYQALAQYGDWDSYGAGVVSLQRRQRLGALPGRQLGVYRPVGLELDR